MTKRWIVVFGIVAIGLSWSGVNAQQGSSEDWQGFVQGTEVQMPTQRAPSLFPAFGQEVPVMYGPGGAEALLNAVRRSQTPEGQDLLKSFLPQQNTLDGFPPAAPPLGASFTGPAWGGIWIPGDPVIAAGSTYVGVMINSQCDFYTKAGVWSGGSILKVFFAPVYDSLNCRDPFDVKIIYDHHANKWVMLALTYCSASANSYYLVAVSQTMNPLGSWWIWALDVMDPLEPVPLWADYPGLGFDADSGVYITSNQYLFGGGFQYAKIRALRKGALYTGTAAWWDYWGMIDADGITTTFTIKPVHTFGNPGTEYLVNSKWAGGNTVDIWSVLPGDPFPMNWGAVGIGWYFPPPVPPCSDSGLNLFDCRTQDAQYRNEYVYTSFHEEWDWGAGIKAVVRFLKIDIPTMTPAIDERYGHPEYHYFFPSIYSAPNDNIVTVFNRCGGTEVVEFPSARYSARFLTQGDVASRASLYLQAGQAWYGDWANPNRWGDYSGIAYDPFTFCTMWIYSMYSTNAPLPANWSTWIGSVFTHPGEGGDSLYWKPEYEDYAPNGMPDIDQKQDNWIKTDNGRWTFCGPAAVANCFKWFDSKYNVPPGFPGDGNDQFPLVRDYMDNLPSFFAGVWDDHDPWNVDHVNTPWGPPANPPPATPQPFIPGAQPQPSGMPAWGELVERLAWYFDTDGIQSGYCAFSGTKVQDMQNGIDQWLLSEQFSDGSTLWDSLYERTLQMPSFAEVETLVEMCEDVILLLGFWYEDPAGSGDWWRCGGHYVTVAGINSDSLLIALSDPWYDNAEAGGRGRIGTGNYIAHVWPHTDPTIHNDEGNVSHDIYTVSVDPVSPAGLWELADYPVSLNPMDCYNFEDMNVPDEYIPVSQPWTGVSPIFTEVEYAVVISPRTPPDTLRNHFKTWRVEPEPFTQIVSVQDQFMQDNLVLDQIDFLSNPTRKDSFEILDGIEHLTWYRAHGRDTLLEVEYTNQFGTYTNTIDSVKYLLLPTAKELPEPFPEELDHYKAYRIRDPVSFDRDLVLEDQFDIMFGDLEYIVTLEPKYFLTPALKNMPPPMFDSLTHYVAYEIFPQHYYGPIQVQTFDQFGERSLQVDTSKFLLVPTRKLRAEPPPHNPPEIGQPDFLEGYVDSVVEYDITGNDPDGDVILDEASIDIQPGCGSWNIVRTSGHGTSTGVWRITWDTEGCTPCDTHMVIHDLTDETGLVGYCTTWVHLSEKPWLNHKMHHPQLPDLEGWDVFALDPKTLADDWQCSETGWVKDIHFWGSWRDLDGDPYTDDYYTQMPWFRLSIHRNIPASADTPWSRPGEQIWSWEGEIPGTSFEPPAMEHWFNPNTNEVLYNDHVPYWRYDFFFDLADPLPAPFYQHKDSVYWLDVSAIGIPAPYEWGWKSSRDHFMDDAVYTDTPPDGPWYPLFEPPRANWFDVYFNSAGEPVDTGSTNYYGEGWYAYEYWWNMWFFNNPFVTNPKHIWLDFYVEELGPAAYVEFAINWSTDLWATEGVPGRPPLPGEDETLYIGREVFEVFPGSNTVDFWIDEYNPEWVSIDFVGADVRISGWVWHECVQTSMDLAFVITGEEAPPDTLRNHYKTWWFAPEMFEGTVFVQDQFMEDSLSLVRSDFLSNPVKKVVENDTFDIIRPDDHLTWYMVSGRDTLVQVGYVNQFESTTVAIDVPKFLLVPTQKGDHVPPENLDHYKAYRIQNPVEFPVELVLEDQFDVMYGAPEDIDSLKPRYFLAPAIKNMEQPQLFDSVTHYVAYEIFPRRPFSLSVDTWDQFGSHVLYIQYSEMLLVPSKKFLVTVPESLYWKASYEDYAPSGMPDIDQKQDNWMKAGTGSYTFCGPVAVANCFKWFDSKYNVPPGAPGDGMDQFPLVRDYLDNLAPFIPPARDDHDPWNVDHAGTPWGPPANPPPATAQPFIPGPQPQPSTMPAWGELVERLAWYFNTDGIQTGYCQFSGTNVYDMQNGIEEWFLSEQFEDGSTIADSLYEYTIPMPTFAEVETLVEMCEDVILLLGFWYEDPPGSGDWWRCGGHYVTVAGVNSEDLLIAVADPFFDNAEAGGRGRVGDGTLIPHPHGSHDGTVHNDEGNVSHDIYSVATDPVSPGGEWELVGYPVSLNPGYCYDFSEQNIPPEFETMTQPWNGTSPIFTEVEYAVVISPRNHPPEIIQPDSLEGFIDDTVTYTFDGVDPNGDVILDAASLQIVPSCGAYSVTRIAGHGTSSGTWRVTWYTDDCTACTTYRVIVDLTDEHGATSYCTTYVHLSSPRECDDNDPHECDTLYVECGNMLVPPGGGLVKVDMSIAYDETLKAVQVPLSYQGSPECCDSMPENENTVAQVFAGSILPATWIKVVTIDHQAKEVVVAGVALMPPTDCLMPGRGHLGTLTLFGDSCCTIQLDTTDYAGNHVGFADCNDPSMTLFYPVCRIDTCHIDRNYPPEIGQPDFLEGLVDDLVTYTITGNDPDGDVIRDTASIDIEPGCGSDYYITRISGHGTSSGTWEIRWYTDGCTPCDTHMVIHDLTDVNGLTSYCTTWVHLSEPESLYWKPPYEDYAPNGMVDIDQKQDGWLKFDTDQWSFCGPCAVANCFKWFDSKYNVPPGAPGDGMDQFPLVRDYMDNLMPFIAPAWDDHDPWNVDHTGTPWNAGIGPPPLTAQPFVPGPQPQPSTMPPWGELVERLAWFFDTDGIQSGYCNHTGTNVLQMQQGIQDWFESEMFEDSSTIADTLCMELTRRPNFAYVESLVEKCEDVILLLGFWYEDPPGSGQWFRIGGHYVTVAGVNSETYRIAFSDPFIDAAEFGAPGRVGDGMLIPHSFPHDPTVHNDEGNVSHDIYTADTNSISPGGDWWLPDYAINGDPGYWSWNFHRQNVPDEFLPFTASWNGTSPIFTEVEYCIHISPWDYRGDVAPTGGNGVIDVGDAVYILNYLFKAGPAPDPYIEGDTNCDGLVNLSDAITILNYLFKGWGVPRCCDP
jgi:hypothetical protein